MIIGVKKWLQQSNYTVVFTGAGMSTESGLPDFRSSKGMWKQKDPSRIASIDALNNNVQEFIEFYRERVIRINEYKPHKGHYILADWENRRLIHGFHQQQVQLV